MLENSAGQYGLHMGEMYEIVLTSQEAFSDHLRSYYLLLEYKEDPKESSCAAYNKDPILAQLLNLQ